MSTDNNDNPQPSPRLMVVPDPATEPTPKVEVEGEDDGDDEAEVADENTDPEPQGASSTQWSRFYWAAHAKAAAWVKEERRAMRARGKALLRSTCRAYLRELILQTETGQYAEIGRLLGLSVNRVTKLMTLYDMRDCAHTHALACIRAKRRSTSP